MNLKQEYREETNLEPYEFNFINSWFAIILICHCTGAMDLIKIKLIFSMKADLI